MSERAYLSRSELARKLNLPESRIRRAVREGRLVPDFVLGRSHAFSLERVPAIVQTLAVRVEQN